MKKHWVLLKMFIFALRFKNAKVAQLVEHDLAKVGVAGSNPVFRSRVPMNSGFSLKSPVPQKLQIYDLLSFSSIPRIKTSFLWIGSGGQGNKVLKILIITDQSAQVVELVDTKDLKSFDHCGRAGSSPALGTQRNERSFFWLLVFFVSFPKILQ